MTQDSGPDLHVGRDLQVGRNRRRSCLAVVVCLAIATACNARKDSTPATSADASIVSPPEGLGLQPVTLPDFAGMEAPAREQMQARFSSLRSSIRDTAAPRDRIGTAYGEMGKLLMAATYLDAAESCYLNAQLLAPNDYRWPYYLGHIYKVKGPLAKAVTSFERALQLKPDDAATLVWLGEAHLAQGHADVAAPLFARALTLQPDSAAARFGAGRVALARKDHASAVKYLEEALAREPAATTIHYPLAMAYRGLGNLGQAEAHLSKQGDIETHPVDPLMRELDGLLQSPEAFNVRGGRELDAGNWAAAARDFRKGLDLSPNDPSLRHRLGTALAQMGDIRGATEEFERVVQTSPTFARAYFSLGVIYNESRQYEKAIGRFSDTLKYEPGYVQARVQLARALSHSGRMQEAVDQYSQALAVDPTLSQAVFGYAIALTRLHRYAEARDRLSDGMKTFPDEPMFTHALARLLVSAPDDRVRDGRQAKTLVDGLLKGPQTIELGETTAMMLAELGDFTQAAVVQRDVLAAAEQRGLGDVVRRGTENLRRYERRQPCRTPFTEDELP